MNTERGQRLPLAVNDGRLWTACSAATRAGRRRCRSVPRRPPGPSALARGLSGSITRPGSIALAPAPSAPSHLISYRVVLCCNPGRRRRRSSAESDRVFVQNLPRCWPAAVRQRLCSGAAGHRCISPRTDRACQHDWARLAGGSAGNQLLCSAVLLVCAVFSYCVVHLLGCQEISNISLPGVRHAISRR